MKRSSALGESVERLEVQTDVRNRPRGDGEVVALGPFDPVIDHDRAPKRLGEPLNHGPSDHRAADTARQNLRRYERRRSPARVVLGQKPMHDPRSEEECAAACAVGLRHHVHDVALHDGERLRPATGVAMNEPIEQLLGSTARYADRTCDGVHRATAQQGDLWKRGRPVSGDKAGKRHAVRSVASADGEYVDVGALEVLCDAMKLVDGSSFAHDAGVSQVARQASGRAGVAQVPSALRIDDNADAGHGGHRYRLPDPSPSIGMASGEGPFAAPGHLFVGVSHGPCDCAQMCQSMAWMDVKDQVAAARHGVLALPERDRATFVVTGGDRVSWLNGLVTCDLLKRREGHATYGLFVARSGRILADALIADGGEKVFVSVPSSAVDALRRHLDHYLVMEDAHVAARTDAFSVVSLHGPRSGDVLAAACDAGAIGSIVDRTGLGGAIVVIPEERDAQACGAIDAAARALGGVTGTSDGWQALRLERGIPEFGVDFGDATYPQEAALERVAVSFDKGCYLGQEVVCMLEMRGHVKRKLVVLELEGGDAPPAGASVTADDKSPAGEVTSAVASPTYGHPLALAMLKRAFAEVGRMVSVGGVRGRVVDPPT